MLFLTKKTIASVLALGCLLSISNAQAYWTPNKTQIGVALGAVAALVHYHKVDNTKKDKNVVTRALDTTKEAASAVVNNRYVQSAAVGSIILATAHYHQEITAILKSVGSAIVSSNAKP